MVLFEVTLLGLGEDGHTASLCPNDAALAERVRWVTLRCRITVFCDAAADA